jgi:hypothetical protein
MINSAALQSSQPAEGFSALLSTILPLEQRRTGPHKSILRESDEIICKKQGGRPIFWAARRSSRRKRARR